MLSRYFIKLSRYIWDTKLLSSTKLLISTGTMFLIMLKNISKESSRMPILKSSGETKSDTMIFFIVLTSKQATWEIIITSPLFGNSEVHTDMVLLKFYLLRKDTRLYSDLDLRIYYPKIFHIHIILFIIIKVKKSCILIYGKISKILQKINSWKINIVKFIGIYINYNSGKLI